MSRETTTSLPGSQAMEVVSCPWSEEHGSSSPSSIQLLDVVESDSIFSRIYRCQDVVTSRQYLVKKVQLRNLKEKDAESRLREVDIWKQLRHPNILTCHYGWQRPGPELWILSEAARHSVEHLLLSKTCAPPQALYEKWLYQLASALQYLHEGRDTVILHRNIKPSNIMVVDCYTLKLSDFGFSKELSSRDATAMTQVGSGRTMSPEMVNNLPYNSKTDIWSVGIAAVFIATLQQAVHARTFETLFRKTKTGQVQGIGGRYNRKVQNVINSLLQVDPNHRPSASELVERLRSDFINCARPASIHSYPATQLKRASAGDASGAAAVVVHDDDEDDDDDDCDIVIPAERMSIRSSSSDQKRDTAGRKVEKTRNDGISDDFGLGLPTRPTRKARSLPPLLHPDGSLNDRRSEQQPNGTSTKMDRKSCVRPAWKPSSSSETATPGKPKAKKLPSLTETPGPELKSSTTSTATQCPTFAVRENPNSAEFPRSNEESRRHSDGRSFSTSVTNLSIVVISILTDGKVSCIATPSSSRSPSRRSSDEEQGKVIVQMIRSSTARPTSPSVKSSGKKSTSKAGAQTPTRRNSDQASLSELQQHNADDNGDEVRYRSTKSQRDAHSSRPVVTQRHSDGRLSTTSASPCVARNSTYSSKQIRKDQKPAAQATASESPDNSPYNESPPGSPELVNPVRTSKCVNPLTTREDGDFLTMSEEEEGEPLINTFPGAFNVKKNIPEEPAGRRQRYTVPPGLPRGPARKRETTAVAQRSSQEPDARVLGASATAAPDTESDDDSNPGVDYLSALHVSATHWPANLRQYWAIASDLVTKLGADILLTALKFAGLFTKEEVMMWLHETAGPAGSACIADILTMVELNNQLDEETLTSVHQTLLQMEHV